MQLASSSSYSVQLIVQGYNLHTHIALSQLQTLHFSSSVWQLLITCFLIPHAWSSSTTGGGGRQPAESAMTGGSGRRHCGLESWTAVHRQQHRFENGGIREGERKGRENGVMGDGSL
ncbi:unnamed protein product [Amaranthus hypochondriacus]